MPPECARSRPCRYRARSWPAPWPPRTDQAGGELVQVGLADGYRSGLDQTVDDVSGSSGCVGEGWAARGGRYAGEIDIVLDRKRNAVQGHGVRIGCAEDMRLLEGEFRWHQRDPDPSIPGRRNARKQRLHEFERRRAPFAIGGSEIGNGEAVHGRRTSQGRSTISVSPADSAWPRWHRNSTLVPASSACTANSIFIASINSSASPGLARSPTAVFNCQTLPVTGELIATQPSGRIGAS